VAAVVDHGDAHMAIQCMRSVHRIAEYFHRAFPRQLFRCNGIHSLLLTLRCSLFYTMMAKKTPSLAVNTGDVSATMLLTITGAERGEKF
jgi:hypothetical protein